MIKNSYRPTIPSFRSGGNSYKYLIDQFNLGKFNSNLLNEKKLRPSQKSFPFSVKDLLKTNKKLYCEIIQQENNKELSQIFNLDKVYFSLKNNSYIPKSRWFFHRLINLLIFKMRIKLDYSKIIACDIDNTVANQKIRFEKNFDFKLRVLKAKAFDREEMLNDVPIRHSVIAINSLSNYFNIVWVSAMKKEMES